MKFAFGLSVLINVILLLIVFMEDEPPVTDLSKYTQQDLIKALDVQSGMTVPQVEKLMGKPISKEIINEKEEWHYCKTGSTVDEYVAVTFENGVVTRLTNYNVSWLDMVFHYTKTPTKELINASGLGDCKNTVRWGSYNQMTPSYPKNNPTPIGNNDSLQTVLRN